MKKYSTSPKGRLVKEGLTISLCLKRLIFVCVLAVGIWGSIWPGNAATDQAQIVFIPIKGTIEPGMSGFVERSLDKAFRMGAKKVVLEIDTPGGLIDSAQKIKSLVFASKVPTAAFVSGEAKSAGVLVALAAEEIYMSPAASIGAAEPTPNTEKVRASWRSDLESAAEARGRRADIVAAMVDRNMVIENVKKKGEILSLSAKKAVELGIADQTVRNRNGLLTELAQKDGVYYQAVDITPGWGETLAWWIINPFVAPLLLLIGFAGLMAEAFTPGWGVGGTIGLVALGIYFGGHMMAGVTGWLAIFVFILGVVAILLEIIVIPGFGAAGIIGLALVVWGIFLASTSPLQAFISLTVATVGSIVLIYIMIKVLGHRGMFTKLILGTKLDSASGYNSPKKGMEKYLDLTGVALTPLRPAGSAELAGDRVDVVSDGRFIPQGSWVKVILVEGARIVVKPVQSTKNEEV
ncbi:MAG: serine protease [Firmicutes bacterium HGW-Firmicutes-8]|nr:MAG: serine protease [Firmicutes bacterium HGW-Firmicutes-8]